jgi:hypothetical protein
LLFRFVFAAPVEEPLVADDEPMGFESEISPFFELKDWPSSRVLPSQAPGWVGQALSVVSAKQQAAFLSPPPGFETQASIEESNSVRAALTQIMQNARLSIPERMAQISHGLVWAATTGNAVVLGAILSCRTDPNSNTATPLEASPIHFAAFCGQFAMVDLLVKSGAQVNAQDCRGRTALDWAVVGGQVREAGKKFWLPCLFVSDIEEPGGNGEKTGSRRSNVGCRSHGWPMWARLRCSNRKYEGLCGFSEMILTLILCFFLCVRWLRN